MRPFKPRFKPNTSKRMSQIACALCLSLALIGWFTLHDLSSRATASTKVAAEQNHYGEVLNSHNPYGLHVQFSGLFWNGKPVYVLRNDGETTFEHIVLQSWSEEILPVLYIGPHLPVSFESALPLGNPPYDLRPGQIMCVVAASEPPTELQIVWVKEGIYHVARMEVS